MRTLHGDIFRSHPFYISPASRVSRNKFIQQLFTYHLCQASSSGNIPSVDQAVEMPGRLLNLVTHIIITVEVKDVSDKIKSVLVVLNVCIESRQIEPVCEIVFVDFAIVFVASRRDELFRNGLATILA